MIITVAVSVVIISGIIIIITNITIKFPGSSYHQGTLSAQPTLLQAAPRQVLPMERSAADEMIQSASQRHPNTRPVSGRGLETNINPWLHQNCAALTRQVPGSGFETFNLLPINSIQRRRLVGWLAGWLIVSGRDGVMKEGGGRGGKREGFWTRTRKTGTMLERQQYLGCTGTG